MHELRLKYLARSRNVKFRVSRERSWGCYGVKVYVLHTLFSFVFLNLKSTDQIISADDTLKHVDCIFCLFFLSRIFIYRCSFNFHDCTKLTDTVYPMLIYVTQHYLCYVFYEALDIIYFSYFTYIYFLGDFHMQTHLLTLLVSILL